MSLPLLHHPATVTFALAVGYCVTLGLSGAIVRFVVLPKSFVPEVRTGPDAPRFGPSTVIGKCENLIVVTFVLCGELTGIALVFAAKSLVRVDEIKLDPGYYLGGTLVNLCWSLLMGILLRLLVLGW